MKQTLRIKVITGYRADQFKSIDAEEAHKVYYLFMNPKDRGIFKDGQILVGQDIKDIQPDYHGTMGWNYTHQIDSDDLNQIRGKGIDVALRNVIATARELQSLRRPDLFEMPMSQAVKLLGLPNNQKAVGELSTLGVDKKI